MAATEAPEFPPPPGASETLLPLGVQPCVPGVACPQSAQEVRVPSRPAMWKSTRITVSRPPKRPDNSHQDVEHHNVACSEPQDSHVLAKFCASDHDRFRCAGQRV